MATWSTPQDDWDFAMLRAHQQRLARHRKAVQQDLDALARFLAECPHAVRWQIPDQHRPHLVVDNSQQPRKPLRRYRSVTEPDDAA
jgi:hypothetical protein